MKKFLLRITPFILALPLAVGAAVFTNDTTISPANLAFDGQDIVVSNCTLTVDGPHTFAGLRVGAGGILTHSFGSSGTIPVTASVADEPQVLTGTNEVTLSVSNVLASSVVVKDSSGTITYQTNTDFFVRIASGQGFLQRSDTSTIPDGAMVLVSYDYQTGSITPGLNLNVTSDLIIEAAGSVNVSGRGYGGNAGPGNGAEAGSPMTGAGAGYGGNGGTNSLNALGGTAYGSAFICDQLGSGGGMGAGGVGGEGGGRAILDVSGDCILNGTVIANGQNATNSRSGGGSGGSIWITAPIISGNGVIAVNGGAGEPINGGGGGGGRIALEFQTNQFIGNLSATGGAGWQPGGAGTILIRRNGTAGIVTFDNGGLNGAATPLAFSPPADLIVQGRANVVVAAAQTVGTFLLRSNSTLTTTLTNGATLTLTVLSNAVIEQGALISLDGRGYPQNVGPGIGAASGVVGSGAGHGGYGGYGQSGSSIAQGGMNYDSLNNPNIWGSGGRSVASYPGGAGGGLVRLTVNGLLQLDGKISADGTAGGGTLGGGASGGSIWFALNGFSGTGIVSANGGAGGLPYGGGGGGGRVAITYNSNSFTGMLWAKGGNGAMAGGAGTIYTKQNSSSIADFRADNGGVVGTNTLLDMSAAWNLTVTGGAFLRSAYSALNLGLLDIGTNSTLQLGAGGLVTVTVASNASIATGGRILGDGQGYPVNSGPGAGYGSFSGSSGGGHGGYGGRGGGVSPIGGNTNDQTVFPSMPGSGGGNYSGGTGGAGGAGLAMTFSGPLTLDGKISANGGNGTNSFAGGGAGGTVRLTINNLFSGSGLISADGGDGFLPSNGGGAGGRISVTWHSNAFTGAYSARGGNGFVVGGAGTIYLKNNFNPAPTLIVDNGGLTGTNTVLDLISVSNLIIGPGASLLATFPPTPVFSLTNLDIASNATLRLSANLNISGTTTVAAGGSISADGLGNAGNTGTSPGQYNPNFPSGGGGGGAHAGFGGRGGAALGGTNGYGSLTSPTTTGSGGGGISVGYGASGGGAIRITAGGPFTLNGRISANGNGVVSNYYGAGAGGSVWLTLNQLTGSGSITADGGNAQMPHAGGGGGGRISLTYNFNPQLANPFTGTLSAKGGTGFMKGGAGTIYLVTNQTTPVAIVDNGGVCSTNTRVSGSGTYDLFVQGGAMVTSIGTPRDLFVRSNSWFVHSDAGVTILRNATFDAGGGINLDGLGNSVSGTGSSGGTPKGGGGHGGYGAMNALPLGGTYDSATSPTQSGSPGGNGSGNANAPFGGAGGGSAQFNVGATLLVNGRISADGRNGDLNSGGGSGGGLRLQTVNFAGNGAITANGGSGNGGAGGGGGGRIAIYYATNLFAGTISVCGGNGGLAGGSGTIYLRDTVRPFSTLLLDNCGLFGTNTPLSQSIGLATNISVTGGAVAEFQGIIPVFSNLVVGSGSWLTTRSPDTNLYLALFGDLTLNSGAGINVDAKGYARALGAGQGTSLSLKGSGGGHGGAGGDSASGAFGGITNGSATMPVLRGSGGGNGSGTPLSGSEGGGAVRLSVAGTLALDGLISAGGGMGVQDDAGGGAGGSIWVTAGKFTGSGALAADGGDGDLYGGGGGGGGRIAIYSPMNTFTGAVSVVGGNGAFPGGTGTVYTTTSLTGFDVISQTPLGVVSNVVSHITLDFSEPINPLSVAPDDFVLRTPYGTLAASNLTLSFPAPAMLRINFPTQNVPGDYRLETGPGIESLLAVPMSQVYTGAFSAFMPLISGKVTDTNGQPVAGMLLQPNNGLIPTTTDANGNYSLGVPANWVGTVTPSFAGFLFAPNSRVYNTVSTNVTNQNYLMLSGFVPTLATGVADTNLFIRWQGFSDINYQLYWSTNLATTNWYVSGSPIPGTNGLMELLLPLSAEPQIYFRLRAQN